MNLSFSTSLRGSLSLEPLLALSTNRRLRIIVDNWLRGLSITTRGGPSEEPVVSNMLTSHLRIFSFRVEKSEKALNEICEQLSSYS